MKIFASLFSLPLLLAFFIVWLVASLSKPLTVLSLICAWSKPNAAWRKLQILISTLRYLAFCNDKTWKASDEDVEMYFEGKTDVEKKTIVFVRHGESTWNDTFNRGDRPLLSFLLYFVPNLLKALSVEWYFWIMGEADESWFYDSPLSQKGLVQAQGLQTYLQTNVEFATPREADLLRRLRGDEAHAATSLLVSSNLRRAISTMIVGFQDRLKRQHKTDNIVLLPCLQEISRNPDALSITPPLSNVTPAWTDPKPLISFYENGRIDPTKNSGNKPIGGNGYQRLQDFCRFVFEDASSKETIIACGHSLWFRSFFKTFIPKDHDHIAKRKKLVNGGVVAFTLERTSKGSTSTGDKGQDFVYRIDPKHIVVLYGGF